MRGDMIRQSQETKKTAQKPKENCGPGRFSGEAAPDSWAKAETLPVAASDNFATTSNFSESYTSPTVTDRLESARLVGYQSEHHRRIMGFQVC